MSFLASTTQMLLLGGLTIVAVVALFFVRLRHRRAVVGSALLWERVLEHDVTGFISERLRRWLSLLLALTVALLIALSIGRPYVAALGAEIRPIILVLDSSPSMETRTGSGETRWERASELAKEIVRERTSLVGFMAADTAGRVQTLLTREREQVIAAIDRMRPFPGEQRFPNVPVADAEVYFITDGVAPIDAPVSATTLSVFEAADNVAVTAFEVRLDPASPSGYAAYLEVVNYSEIDKNVAIVLSGSGGNRFATNVELEPAEVWQGGLDLAGFSGGGLRVRIETEGDDLPLDDVAFSYLPARGDSEVMLVTSERDGYLEKLLRLSAKVDLTVVDPEDFREDSATDAYIFDGFAPPVKPGSPSLVFGGADVSWLPPQIGTETDLVIASWNRDHPVMRFVPVHDIKIDSSVVAEPGDWQVVLAGEETPLILVDDGPSETVFVGFDLQSSDFAFQPGFPIFVENTLAWFSGEQLADDRSLGKIDLPLTSNTVMRLDGSPVATEDLLGRTSLELTEPDLLTVVSNNRRIRVAANLTDRGVSNVNQTSLYSESTEAPISLGVGEHELWFYMLLGAMFLAIVEWWAYNRRITV